MASRRAAGRVRKNQLWTALLMEQIPFDDAPVVESNIVQPDDWSLVTGTERATLLRIRGWLAFHRSPLTASIRTMFAMIYLTDSDAPVLAAGTNGPADVLAYLEDVLWTGGWSQDIGSVSATEMPPTFSVEVDVKAMRRITSDQEVRIAFASGGSGNWIASGVLRALVRKSG